MYTCIHMTCIHHVCLGIFGTGVAVIQLELCATTCQNFNIQNVNAPRCALYIHQSRRLYYHKRPQPPRPPLSINCPTNCRTNFLVHYRGPHCVCSSIHRPLRGYQTIDCLRAPRWCSCGCIFLNHHPHDKCNNVAP